MNLAKFSVKRAERKITTWEGFYPAYNLLTKENVINIKKLHSQALLLVYPECRPEVCNLADYIGNTKGIIGFVQTNPAAEEYIVGTELDIPHPLKKNSPDKQFFPDFKKMICQDMKLITLEKILYFLKNLEPQVTVPKKHKRKSSNSLNRMSKISK